MTVTVKPKDINKVKNSINKVLDIIPTNVGYDYIVYNKDLKKEELSTLQKIILSLGDLDDNVCIVSIKDDQNYAILSDFGVFYLNNNKIVYNDGIFKYVTKAGPYSSVAEGIVKDYFGIIIT